MIHHRHKIASYLIALVVMCDQLTKWWVVNSSEARIGVPERVMPFFNLVLVHNRGVTFGIFSRIDHPMVAYAFVAVAVVILLLLGRWLLKTHSIIVTFGLGLIMGGAIGNIIDRLRFGAVIDFLDFYYRDYHWPAFNLADACIVIGVGLLMLDSLVRAR